MFISVEDTGDYIGAVFTSRIYFVDYTVDYKAELLPCARIFRIDGKFIAACKNSGAKMMLNEF